LLVQHLQAKTLDNFIINKRWQPPILEDREYKLNIDNHDFKTEKISKYLAGNINLIKRNGDHAIKEEPVTFRKNEKSRGAPKKEERLRSALEMTKAPEAKEKKQRQKKTAQKRKAKDENGLP